jgi:hypothetical protein
MSNIKETEKIAVKILEKGLLDLKNISYDSIDKLMRNIMKKYNLTAKELHNAFVNKHGEIPDNWIKNKISESSKQNCEITTEEIQMLRYCPKCKKNEYRSECSYGPKYWDMFSLPIGLESESSKKYDPNKPHPANEEKQPDHEHSMARSELSTIISSAKRLRKKLKGEGNIEAWVQSKITKAADYIDSAADYLDSGEHNVHGSMDETNIKTFGEFMKEAVDKSKMKCNSPKSDPVGDSLTGKSHVVKACEGGQEKIIRFGQRGVKGSPKKEGESKAYANRRKRFQTRHAKNISKGKMSAAYWANKVKW